VGSKQVFSHEHFTLLKKREWIGAPNRPFQVAETAAQLIRRAVEKGLWKSS
jgi:hypothetical protein